MLLHIWLIHFTRTTSLLFIFLFLTLPMLAMESKESRHFNDMLCDTHNDMHVFNLISLLIDQSLILVVSRSTIFDFCMVFIFCLP